MCTMINKGDMRRLPKPLFMQWLVKETPIVINGYSCSCYKLDWTVDEKLLEDWALHIRRHYIRDDDLSKLTSFRKISTAEYLQKYKIPQFTCKDRGGPRIVPGDFAEILVADILQFLDNYIVPRYKQVLRANPYSSEQGSDVVAYRFVKGSRQPSGDDEIVIVEVKSAVSRKSDREAVRRIVDAVKGSKKDRDNTRDAMTLNYLMERSLQEEDWSTAEELKRFLDRGEHPYRESFHSAVTLDAKLLTSRRIDIPDLEMVAPLGPVVLIKACNFLNLIKDVYSRCAK